MILVDKLLLSHYHILLLTGHINDTRRLVVAISHIYILILTGHINDTRRLVVAISVSYNFDTYWTH